MIGKLIAKRLLFTYFYLMGILTMINLIAMIVAAIFLTSDEVGEWVATYLTKPLIWASGGGVIIALIGVSVFLIKELAQDLITLWRE